MLPMKNSTEASTMLPSPMNTIDAHAMTPIAHEHRQQPLLDAAVVGERAEDRRQ